MWYKVILGLIIPGIVSSQNYPYEGVQHTCFYKRCLGCPPEAVYSPGAPVDCHLGNWVSSEWLHNLGHPPPWTASKVPVEYRCLKMVATPDDKTWGNTVDVLRGCVPAQQVNSVCSGLVGLERARGHSDARCFTCRGYNCNGVKRELYSKMAALCGILILIIISR